MSVKKGNGGTGPESGRRGFLHKLVSVAAAAGISTFVLAKLIQPVSGTNNIPPSGQATFDGPVGIGTTNPTRTLDVVAPTGTDPLRIRTSGASRTGFLVDATSGQQALLSFLDGGVEKFQFGKHTDNSFFFYDNANGGSPFSIYPTNKVISLDALGLPYKVGIGTPSPSHTLSVAGDVGQTTVAANGLVKAAALVNGDTPAIVLSFNNLPGGSGPTVSRPLGVGTYEVNFGVDVSTRFHLASLLSSNNTYSGGANDGQILVSPRDGNINAVFVRTNDSTGTSTNRSFYLAIF